MWGATRSTSTNRKQHRLRQELLKPMRLCLNNTCFSRTNILPDNNNQTGSNGTCPRRRRQEGGTSLLRSGAKKKNIKGVGRAGRKYFVPRNWRHISEAVLFKRGRHDNLGNKDTKPQNPDHSERHPPFEPRHPKHSRRLDAIFQYPAGNEFTLAISCIFAPATSYTILSFIRRFFCP